MPNTLICAIQEIRITVYNCQSISIPIGLPPHTLNILIQFFCIAIYSDLSRRFKYHKQCPNEYENEFFHFKMLFSCLYEDFYFYHFHAIHPDPARSVKQNLKIRRCKDRNFIYMYDAKTVKRSHLRLSKLVASMMRARILDLSSNDSQFIFDCYSKKKRVTIEYQSKKNRISIEYQRSNQRTCNDATT